MDNLICKLYEAFSVEDDISELKTVIKEYLGKENFKFYEDLAGNLIFKLGSSEDKLLINTGMSTNGYIVTSMISDTCFSVERIGDNLEINLDGKYIRFNGGAIGRINGGNKVEILEGAVKTKEYGIVYEPIKEFHEKLGGFEVSSKALIYCLINTIKMISKLSKEVYFVFSYKKDSIDKVRYAIKEIKPNTYISLTSAQCKEISVITMDKGYIVNEDLKNEIINLAKDKNITLDTVFSQVSSEVDVIHKEIGGIPSVLLALPCENKNSSLQLVKKNDIENFIVLLTKLIEE